MKSVIAGLSAAILLGAGAAMGASGVTVGELSCTSTEIDSAILYTEAMFDCTFEGTNGTTETYTGEMDKVGVDLSSRERVTMVWEVVAATEEAYQPKSLAGTYLSASADVGVGAGAGAGILIGGRGNSFTLQPVTISGAEGTGGSVGIGRFELE